MSSTNDSSWLDITSLCKKASLQMTYNEPLISIDDFSMFDAMNALELMDPKMDASCGLNINNIIRNFDQNDIPILNASIIISLIKLMIINEVAYMDGASLLESTHQCLLLWEQDCYHNNNIIDTLILRSSSSSLSSFYDRILIAYSKCYNKCLTYINSAVLDANIYEDEDFQPSTTPSLSSTNDDLIISDMTNCINELSKKIDNNDDDKKLLSLLESRLHQFAFFATYYKFINNAAITGKKGSKYDIDNDNSDNVDNEKLLQAFELHDTLKKKLLLLLESLNKIDTNDDNDDNKSICSFFFDPIPSKVQQTSAIRTIFFKTYSQSLAHITNICKELNSVCNIFESFLKNAIMKSVFFTDIGSNNKSDSLSYLSYLLLDISSQNMHLLSRSHLMGILFLTASSIPNLVRESVAVRGVPSSLANAEIVNVIWVTAMSVVMWETLKVLTVNRSKLLVRLDNVLASWGNMMSEAVFLDRKFRFDNAFDDERIQWITYWTMCFTTQYMDLHMGLLVEMNLLSVDELDYFYWYWDYINASRSWALERMTTLRFELSMIYYLDDVKANNDKKKKIEKPLPIEPDTELLMIQGKGVIQKRESRYTTTNFLFLQRFRAFQNICNPPMLQYSDYMKTIETGEKNEDYDALKIITIANKCFGITKLIMDRIRHSPASNENNSIDEILRKSVMPLMKVSVASNVNSIRMEQLLKGMKDGDSKIDSSLLTMSLDRAHYNHYPIVEIKKK